MVTEHARLIVRIGLALQASVLPERLRPFTGVTA